MLRASNLQNGEKLFILRRRAGNTQAQEAAARGLPLTAYKALEVDEDCEYTLNAEAVGKVEDFEACVTVRRRKKMTLDDLSGVTRLSKWYLCLIEKDKAPVGTLLTHWQTNFVPA